MIPSATPVVKPLTVLRGHTSPENAHVISDAPYGSFGNKRCTFQYWVETCEKGAKKGQQRFVYRTTNPDKPGMVWNKPKCGIYSLMTLMCRDADDNIVPWYISVYSVYGADEYRTHLSGVYAQLTGDQREVFDYLAKRVRQGSPTVTRDADETLAMVMDHIHDTGYNPVAEDGFWIKPDGSKGLYLGSGDDPEVTFAYARALLAGVERDGSVKPTASDLG